MSYTAGIYFGSHTVTLFSSAKTARVAPTSVKVKLSDSDDEKEIVPWGADNDYPQRFLDALRKNGVANAGLKILKATHYGEGFTLYKEEYDDNGKRTKKVVPASQYTDDLKKFVKENKLPKFWNETIADLETLSIAFPEYVLSKDGKKIVRVKRQKAAHGRFEKMSKKNIIENIYFRTDWKGDDLKDGYTSKIRMFDPYMTVAEIKEIVDKKKIKNFVIPVFYPMLDESYYPVTDWHSVYRNGWMDVANAVPKLKQAIFENQLHIKYIIYVSDIYFKRYYGTDWDDFTPKKREELRKELHEAIDEHLSGNQAGGRSIVSPIFKDDAGNWQKGITVEAIDNKLKDGNYLPDAVAANSEVSFAQGVDASLIGSGVPGGKLGAGSGSDKRVAFTILATLFKSKRETTFEIWNFIRDFNEWEEDLIGDFPNTVLTTLDKNPTGKETTI